MGKQIKGNTFAICSLGKEHPCMLNVNDGYCCAAECIFMVHERDTVVEQSNER